MPVTPAAAAAALSRLDDAARLAREERAASVRARVLELVRAWLPGGARAWLIGSLAWGGFGVRSDVDLVVDGATSAEAIDLELRIAASERLAADVLRLEELPESFRARVDREGLRIDG